jgi:hypothetical protein
MLRHLQIDPQFVLEILKSMGCELGPASQSLRAVTNPKEPGLTTVLDLTGPMDGEVIETHLSILELDASDFLSHFNKFKAPFTD